MADRWTGRQIGAYEIEQLIGRGGMATVYRARHRHLDRPVALKLMSSQVADDPTFLARFKREATLAARLDHPNVVAVYDFGEQDDTAYLVMALVDGGSLRERLTTLAPGETLPLPMALDALAQVAAGLDHAHERGLIHRDIKPANILIRRALGSAPERYLLADFGIARAAADAIATQSISLTGTGLVGTPIYMSPEQCWGEPVDARSDIYSLAIVAYELLVGRRPFEGETLRVINAHAHQPPPDPCQLSPYLPSALGAALLAGLAKEPQARPQRASEFVAGLVAGARSDQHLGQRTALRSFPPAPALVSAERPAEPADAGQGLASPPASVPVADRVRQAPRLPGWLLGALAVLAVVLGIGGLITAALVVGRQNGPASTSNTPPAANPTGAAAPAASLGGLLAAGSPTTAAPRAGAGAAAAPAPLITFTRREGSVSKVYVMNADGSNLRRLTDSAGYDGQSVFAPDGQQIAFAGSPELNGKSHIYVVNLDGTGLRQVTQGSGSDFNPAWSPDGQQIAFESNGSNNSQIYVIDRDGQNLQRLTNHPSANEGYPAWSPDGRQLTFHSDRAGGGFFRVYRMNADGSAITPLDPSQRQGQYAAWSPDGQRVCFTSNRTGTTQLWLINADGSGLTQLTSEGQLNWLPAWLADGQTIVYTATRQDNVDQIWAIQVDGSNDRRLTYFPGRDSQPKAGPR